MLFLLRNNLNSEYYFKMKDMGLKIETKQMYEKRIFN